MNIVKTISEYELQTQAGIDDDTLVILKEKLNKYDNFTVADIQLFKKESVEYQNVDSTDIDEMIDIDADVDDSFDIDVDSIMNSEIDQLRSEFKAKYETEYARGAKQMIKEVIKEVHANFSKSLGRWKNSNN